MDKPKIESEDVISKQASADQSETQNQIKTETSDPTTDEQNKTDKTFDPILNLFYSEANHFAYLKH